MCFGFRYVVLSWIICLTMSDWGHGILESCDAKEIASIFNNECWKMSQDTKVRFLFPDNSAHTAK